MSKTFKKALIVSTLVVLLIIGSVMVSSINANILKTEVTNVQTVTQSVYTQGYFSRNETVIENNTDGYISYEVLNGDKVSKGSVVANIYNSYEDANTRDRIDEIDEQIDNFEKINIAATTKSVSISSVSEKITESILGINKMVLSGDLSTTSDNENNVLYYLNEKQIIVGDVVSYNYIIEELKEEKETLEQNSNDAIAQIVSPESGYFVYEVDGYETLNYYDEIEDMTLQDLENALEQKPKSISSNAIGKVVSEYKWYIECKISNEDVLDIKNNSEQILGLYVPYVTTQEIPAKIVSMYQEEKDSDAIIIFECNSMNEDIASLRNETIKIDIKEYTGLVISKEALHEDMVTQVYYDNSGEEHYKEQLAKGVYVIVGNTLQFKEVDIIYITDYIYICRTNYDDEYFYSKDILVRYDIVAVEGNDLHDGKSI